MIELEGGGASLLVPGSSLGPSIAPVWELVWMLDGTAALWVDGVRIEHDATRAVLVRPGQAVRYRWGRERIIRQAFLLFTADEPSDAWPREIPLTPGGIIPALLDHVLSLEEQRPEAWQLAAGDCFRMILKMVERGHDSVTRHAEPELPPPITASIRLVAQNWSESDIPRSFTLAELARAAGVTSEYLCRIYTRQVGFAPVAALRLLKVRRATILLTRTDLAIGEIAYRLGFTSQYQFSKTFRGAVGVAPSAYRQNPSAFELPASLRPLEWYFTAQW